MDHDNKQRKVIYITGMSGTGKSTSLEHLSQKGYKVVDTDDDRWSTWIELPDGSRDWILREDAMHELLTSHEDGILFIAGCKTNQELFYPYFDEVVLFHAPTDVLRERILTRTDNDYGKHPDEWVDVVRYIDEVVPLLRRSATVEIDTSQSIEWVVYELIQRSNL